MCSSRVTYVGGTASGAQAVYADCSGSQPRIEEYMPSGVGVRVRVRVRVRDTRLWFEVQGIR